MARGTMDLRLLMEMQMSPSVRRGIMEFRALSNKAFSDIGMAGAKFSGDYIKNLERQVRVARIAEKDKAQAAIQAHILMKKSLQEQTALEGKAYLSLALQKERTLEKERLAIERLAIARRKAIAEQAGEFRMQGSMVGKGQALGAAQAGIMFNELASGRTMQPGGMQAQAMANLATQAKFASGMLITMGNNGQAAYQRLRAGANSWGNAQQEVNGFLGFSHRVLQAFLLYKGFVFLKMQVEEFVTTLVDLEHGLALVQTQLSSNEQSINSIKESVIEVGQTTGLAFGELAKTQFEIISANIQVARSFEVLDLSAKAAVAGGLQNVSTAFNAALTQVNAFKLSNAEFGRVFDLQFNLVKRGIFTYEQLAGVIGEISIAFAGMGQEVEVANAALAAISQIFTGPQLEQGATGLKNAVIRMTTAFDEFESMGVKVIDPVSGEFRDFLTIMKDLDAQLSGLTEAGRAEALKKLFPDIRERRGIQALLTQMDDLNEFYVEQKLSLGDLDKAYETVQETTKIQVGILKNNLVPTMEGVLDVFNLFVTGINNINTAVPGFTSNVFALAAAMTVLKLAMATSTFNAGGKFAMTTGVPPIGAGATAGGRFLSRFSAGAPTRLGKGLIGGMGGLGGFAAGRKADTMPMDVFGSLAGGAATGAMIGGPWGAAIGAGAAGLGLIVGQMFEQAEEPITKTFSTAFAEAIKENKANLKEAFDFAQGFAITSNGLPDFSGVGVTPIDIVAQRNRRNIGDMHEMAQRKIGVPVVNEVAAGLGTAGGFISGLFGDSGEFGTKEGSGKTLTTIIGDLRTELKEFDERAKSMKGIVSEEELRAARVGLIEERINSQIEVATGDMSDEEKKVVEANKILARNIIDAGLSAQETDQAFAILREGGPEAIGEFFDFLRGETREVGGSIVKTLLGFQSEFDAKFKGDFAAAANVFSHIGTEGKRLADAFRLLQSTSEAFSMAQKIFAIEVTRNGTTGPLFNQEFQSKTGELIFERTTGLDFSGLEKISPEQFVDALFPSGVDQFFVPAATNLADSFFAAADAVDMGLTDEIGFTSESLHSMGTSLDQLNHLIAKTTILQEFQRIADIAGVSGFDMSGIMRSLLDDMQIAGKNFIELLSDPEKVAELLTKLEFGDINLDQSTNQQIVVRISGDQNLDTLKAARIAEDILKEIDTQTRSSRSSFT